MTDNFQNLLGEFAKKIPELLAAAVVSIEDGLLMADFKPHTTDVNVGAVAAYLACIVQSDIKASTLFEWDQVVEDILITTDASYFFIQRPPNRPYFYFVMTNRNAWIGRVRVALKELGTQIVWAVDGKPT